MSAVAIPPSAGTRGHRLAPLPFEHRPALDGIRAVAALLVILFHAGTPFFGHGEPMIDCLSTGTDPESCSAPAFHPPGTTELRELWRSLPDATTVSFDQLICPDGSCPVVVGGIPTHRDTNHLTIAYSLALANSLDVYLRQRGVVLAAGTARLD